MRLLNTSAIVLAFAASACDGGGGSRTFGLGTGPGTGPSTTNQISVRDDNFNPSSTTVPVGTTVTWTWAGVNIHNVTFPNGPSSANQTTGGTFQRTFSAAGTFPYTCTNHAGMNGTVIVQ
jgi:plastocyanin